MTLSRWWLPRLALGVVGLLPFAAPGGAVPPARAVPQLPPEPFFGHRTTADGLPDDTVRSLLQDHVGFLWIGTQNGLARYDGSEMRVFRPVLGDSTAIGGRAVFALHEDAFGCIWAGTAAGGLSRLDPRTGIFTNYTPVPGDDTALPGRFVLGIDSTPDSTLWVALQDGGLVCRKPGREGFTRIGSIGHRAATSSDSLTALLAARDGTLFVGVASGGVGHYTPATDSWRFAAPKAANPNGPRPGLINHIEQDAAGRIWFATASGLARWDAATGALQWSQPRPDAPDDWANYLTRIAEDAQGQLWIAAAVGLYRFDPSTGRFQLFRHDPRRAGSIAPGPVMTVATDRAGTIWTGGWQAGVSFLDPWRTRFTVLAHTDGDEGSLDQNAVVSVLESADGTLWAGTGGVTGVGEVGRLNRRRPGEKEFARIALPADTRTVLALCEAPDGALWIGTDRGLLHLPPGSSTAQKPSIPGLDTAALALSGVYTLTLDRSGNLWVGSFGRGLYRIDRAQGTVARFLHDPNDPRSLSQNRITRLHCDAAGRMWVGTSTAGINLYEPGSSTFRRFVEPRSGLGTITDFDDTPDGGVCVATTAGLFVVQPDSARALAVDRECGVADVAIASLGRTRDGELWIHTVRGLVRCSGASGGTVQAYEAYSGVPPGEIYFGSYRGPSGVLYFGSKHGLLVVDPHLIRADPNVPPVVLTGLQVNDVDAGPETPGAGGHVFPFVERIVLPYDQNDLRVSFAALQLAQPERVRYRYRLHEDDRWRTPSTPGLANYTNVTPGSYRFEVQVGTADGGWSPEGASLAVVITPPWWWTNWARAAYVLLALGAVALVYRSIVQRERIRTALEVERAEARHLQELDQVKSRFFANISHEFRTPLTLILGPIDRLRQSAGGEARTSLDMIHRNARRLGELIEQLLDLSRLESGHVTVRWQRRDALTWLRALVSSFDSHAVDRGVSLTTEIPTTPLEVWFEPDLFEKIVVNLLSNAFKFTPPGGEVRVEVDLEAGEAALRPQGGGRAGAAGSIHVRPLRIVVANTGSYIPVDSQAKIFERFHQLPEGEAVGGTGIGLALTKELIELLDGSITVESERERGTRFTVVLPMYTSQPATAVTATASAEAPLSAREVSPVVMPVEDVEAEAVADTAEVGEGQSTRPRVLVVEDNADLRAFLSSELDEVCEVLQAADGTAGLALAIEELPDLVLSDVIMPGIDGIELCRRLKSDPRTDHIPVVLLSARTEVESRLEGLESGADDYQAKPFDPRELRLRVRNQIEERRRLRERYAHQMVQLGAAAMSVTSAEERFLKRACEIIDAHIDEPQFGVEELAIEIGMSKTQLLRKVRAVTGAAPRDLIRTHRLQRAAHLLASGYGNVTEVAYAVGMESLSTFAKRFREQYGVPPSEYPSTVAKASPAPVEPNRTRASSNVP